MKSTMSWSLHRSRLGRPTETWIRTMENEMTVEGDLYGIPSLNGLQTDNNDALLWKTPGSPRGLDEI